MNLDHLMWSEDGWGYLPPTDEVFRIIEDTINYTDTKNLFEIGFYAGHSTTYWAELMDDDATIVSCCPEHPRGIEYSKIIMDKYPNVTVHLTESPQVYDLVCDQKFDLAFIDGNHVKEKVMIDAFMCNQLEIPFYLFDNVECVCIRELITQLQERGQIEVMSEFTYKSNFKGKVSTNQMTLVNNTRIF